MREHLPDEVRNELQRALSEIAAVLVETNNRLSEQEFSDYYMLSASLNYNDPNNLFKAVSAHVALAPVDDNDNETAFNEIRETSEVAVYSPSRGEITDNIKLSSPHLSASSVCNEDTVGDPCGHGRRCKYNYTHELGYTYYCGRVNK